MRRLNHQVTSGEDLFVGIDLHKHRWHVTIRTVDVEVFSASIPGTWEALQRVLARYAGHQLQAVYEAGYFGFRLHDRLVAHGIPCLVTPPSLVPQEHGNRVKTDRRDSSKLAHLLAKGLLKRVWLRTSGNNPGDPADDRLAGTSCNASTILPSISRVCQCRLLIQSMRYPSVRGAKLEKLNELKQ